MNNNGDGYQLREAAKKTSSVSGPNTKASSF